MRPLRVTDEPMAPRAHRVQRRAVDGPDTVTLHLVPETEHDRLGPAGPGQFLMVWAFGIGEIPISVSGVEPDGTIELTVRAAGATSAAIAAAHTGDLVGLRGPFGTTWPLGSTRDADVVVIAGGLGLAPLRMAVESLVGGATAARSVTVLVGARRPDQLLYPEDRERWRRLGRDRLGSTATQVAVDSIVDAADQRWTGRLGTVTDLWAAHRRRADVAFVCGPERMMLATAQVLVADGIAADRVHVSLERNMHCGVAHCGRCQLGPVLLCRDGAVVDWARVGALVEVQGR